MKVNLNDLLILRSLLDDEIIRYLSNNNANNINKNIIISKLLHCAEKFGLSGNILSEYIIYHLINQPNLVSDTIERCNTPVSIQLKATLLNDINIILPMLQKPTSSFISTNLLDEYIPSKPLGWDSYLFFKSELKSAKTAEEYTLCLIKYYEKYGYGEVALHKAFQFDSNKKILLATNDFDSIYMKDLVGYEEQKNLLIKNTKAFIRGKASNHVLLVGARGTGKSSMIRSLGNEFFSAGLRVVQLKNSDILQLPEIMSILAGYRRKYFLLFLDDLSFDSNDFRYRELKSAIDGGVNMCPNNIRLYATSNYRHIVHEHWNTRNNSEHIHSNDQLNDILSLSDRFGLIIHYYPPTQDQYLNIIRQELNKHNIILPEDELRLAGVRWEMSHSGRSGRIAKQFVDYYTGTQL